MNILAVDTSSYDLNVGVKTAETYVEQIECELRGHHSEMIMPFILKACEEAKVKVKDLELLACTRGPGSFTGLRIGMATLKGLASGIEAPVVSVSTLETYATSCKNDVEGTVITVLDAKKQRWYLAAFEIKNGNVTRVFPDTDGTEEDLVSLIKGCSSVTITGPDCKAFSEVLKSRFKDKEFLVDEWEKRKILPALIELARKQLEIKGADDIGQGPVYIRKSDAETALEERLRENKGE